MQTQKNQYDIESILQGEDEKIEEELQKLKDISRQSSMESLIGPVNLDLNSA